MDSLLTSKECKTVPFWLPFIHAHIYRSTAAMFICRRMLLFEILEILGIYWLHAFKPDFEPYFDFEYLAKIYHIITKHVFTKIPTKIPNALSYYNRITLLMDHTRYKAFILYIWKRLSVLWRNWSVLSEISHKAWSLVLKPNALQNNKNEYCFGIYMRNTLIEWKSYSQWQMY